MKKDLLRYIIDYYFVFFVSLLINVFLSFEQLINGVQAIVDQENAAKAAKEEEARQAEKLEEEKREKVIIFFLLERFFIYFFKYGSDVP